MSNADDLHEHGTDASQALQSAVQRLEGYVKGLESEVKGRK